MGAKLAVFIAALFHDVRHPGIQARYLLEARHAITLTYCTESPLESMHTAEILRLLQAHGCMNFKDSDYRSFRRLLVGMVLSTDLASGYKNLANVKDAFPSVFTDRVKPPGPDRRESVSRKSTAFRNSAISATLPSTVGEIEIDPPSIDVTQDLLNLVVECADVSHPARGLEIHKRWSI